MKKRWIVIIIVLVALSACGGGEEVPDEPNPKKHVEEEEKKEEPFRATSDYWKNCLGEKDYNLTTLECGEVILVHTPMQSEAADSGLLRKIAVDVTTGFIADYPGIELSNLQMPDELRKGRSQVVFDLQVEADEGGTFPAKGTTIIKSDGPTSMTGVICFDMGREDLSRCGPLTNWLFVRGVPENASIEDVSKPPMFAGREVKIPEGCSTQSGEDIACGRIRVNWVHEDPTNPGDHARYVEAVVDSVGKAVRSEPESREKIDCKIDGVLTECDYLTFPAGDNRVYLLTSTTKVRDRNVGTVCAWATGLAPKDEVPKPCDVIYSVREWDIDNSEE